MPIQIEEVKSGGGMGNWLMVGAAIIGVVIAWYAYKNSGKSEDAELASINVTLEDARADVESATNNPNTPYTPGDTQPSGETVSDYIPGVTPIISGGYTKQSDVSGDVYVPANWSAFTSGQSGEYRGAGNVQVRHGNPNRLATSLYEVQAQTTSVKPRSATDLEGAGRSPYVMVTPTPANQNPPLTFGGGLTVAKYQ